VAQDKVRNSTRGALAFLDLNDFKVINDRNGPAIGDQVLTFTAKQLKQMLRPADTTSQG